MKKKIYYWSPCLTKIGTIKSTINSAIAMANYGKVKYDVYLINSCGEWDDYIDYLSDKNVNLINFRFKIFKYLPKNGFLKSRISYILIYLFSFFPLLKLLKKNKPDFLIVHLITSLPLTLLKLFKFKTEFILRISGMPKLNFFRKNLWKSLNRKLKIITCPTNELKNQLINNKYGESSGLIQKVLKTFILIFIGTMALTISAKLKIPFYPVPMTMQTFVVLFLGIAFGYKIGLASVAVYLLEGILGMPVFSNSPEKGIGIVYFTGPTMGYLIGFLFASFFAGYLNLNKNIFIIFGKLIFSVSVIYVFGAIWLGTLIGWDKPILQLGVTPFLLAELFKICLLAILAKKIIKFRKFI